MFVGKTVLFLVSPNDDVSRQLFHSRQLATVFTLLIFVMPAFQCNRFDAAKSFHSAKAIKICMAAKICMGIMFSTIFFFNYSPVSLGEIPRNCRPSRLLVATRVGAGQGRKSRIFAMKSQFSKLCPTFCQGGVPLTPEKITYLAPPSSQWTVGC